MRQIDEVHDAKNQRQAGSHKKQQDPELGAVQKLQKEEIEHRASCVHIQGRPGPTGTG